MLADHLHAAAAGARTAASLDETARLLWRAHAEAQIPDAEAGAISEAIEARRAALAGKCPAERPRPVLGLSGAARKPERREKMLDGGKDSYQIITHGQLRWSDASSFGAAAARTAAARAPMTYLARNHRTG